MRGDLTGLHGYFFLKTPPDEQMLLFEFRTINITGKKSSSRELIGTYYHMIAIQDWMRDYLINSGSENLSFVGSCKLEIQRYLIDPIDAFNKNISKYIGIFILNSIFQGHILIAKPC